jgi:hypothetical protein
MTIHVLVEGPSERAFLDRWVSRLLPDLNVRVHPHQGKGSLPKSSASPDPKARGLLDQLPAKLRGLATALDPKVDRVLVLVDADDDDVALLARAVMAVAADCAPQLRVETSVAVEEMEAFYLGDLRALHLAFPAADMDAARAYVPDSIRGTWELFGQIVGDGGGNKVAWAQAMGPHVTTLPAQSRSPSFRGMVQQILALVPEPRVPRKKRPYHHLPRGRKRGDGRR